MSGEQNQDWVVYDKTTDDEDCFFEAFRPTRLCGRGIDWVLVNAVCGDCTSSTPFVTGRLQEALQAEWVARQTRILEEPATDGVQIAPRSQKLELEQLRRQQKHTECSSSKSTQSLEEHRDTSRVWYKHKGRLRKEMDSLGEKFNCKEGKFVIFAPEQDADFIWMQIIRATLDNRLGTRARTRSTTGADKSRPPGRNGLETVGRNTFRDDGKVFIIEVYSANYLDLEDAARVRQRLSEMKIGIDIASLSYKPEIYSQLGIYSNNRWGLPPTRPIYVSKYIK
ncbi:hypothetical protein SARC_04105 [Sphaeroforma arctica JP610]|uniref:Uncharacterized protein n=1 Tax=Sphaeroforma arctica JP610 TaxID=667725 RepID=A0A0L0G457_9EUKA|nr:hypothetical protein SARC_04105 [Sphaeroforma arctica JP610]KNC83644.1 hypothetical protein SARC_04105 [Sphaeroforma arctica JP610]|eukprot:XP_014157546.1 hypothetical protein SARC_04105 [Sphaeroforma arctica JP610]